MSMESKKLLARGHLIDSGILTAILNLVVEEGGDYQIGHFNIGKTNDEESELEIEVTHRSEERLGRLLEKLARHGCYEKAAPEGVFKASPADRCAPDDFYSSTNHRSEVFSAGAWHPVQDQRMDAVIVAENGSYFCRKLRDLRNGDSVLCSGESVRVFPPARERHADVFSFMANSVSSERNVDTVVESIATDLKTVRASGGKIVWVAGPVVVHTGGSQALCRLIQEGFVQGILSGNALAVHDIERVLFGTSLGVDLESGRPTHDGHRNHMRAINAVNRHGSIHAAVAAGKIRQGIMYELCAANIPYCLAGSIRDDGPLPDTITDMIEAQEAYRKIIENASVVIMLSTMLHSIGTGNMLPSWVKTICVDINPAVVTKLGDRGSGQAIGIVSDVGLFLRALADKVGP